jgi:hypothetical protein
MELNDELLSAYLDGELAPAQREQVAAALLQDAGARLRLERMQQADQALRAAMPATTNDHFQAAMAAKISGSALAARSWQRTVLPWALAASLVGLTVGYVLPRGDAGGFAQPDATWLNALNSTPSGTASSTGVTPLLSFKTVDGRYCRLFRAQGAASGEGLVCRSAEQWQLVAWDATTPEPAEGFRAAGASALVDGAMSALGGSPAMDLAEERAVIAREWR